MTECVTFCRYEWREIDLSIKFVLIIGFVIWFMLGPKISNVLHTEYVKSKSMPSWGANDCALSQFIITHNVKLLETAHDAWHSGFVARELVVQESGSYEQDSIPFASNHHYKFCLCMGVNIPITVIELSHSKYLHLNDNFVSTK